jgi:hypothetical protein
MMKLSILSLVLAAGLLLVLSTGCSDDDKSSSNPEKSEVTGDWRGEYSIGGAAETMKFTMNLVQTEDAVTGTYRDSVQSYPITGTVGRDAITLTIAATESSVLEFKGDLNRDYNAINGTVKSFAVSPPATGSWSAKRR